ncbi:MAG: ATP-binding protein [Actinomycetota bacterium]
MVSTSTLKSECVDCHKEFNAKVIVLFGKPKIPEEPRCPGCQKAYEEKLEEQLQQEQRRADELRIKNTVVNKCGLKYVAASFDSFKPLTAKHRRMLEISKEFVAAPAGSLFFYGLAGRGKTYLAVAIYRELINDADFWPVPDLLLHLRSELRIKGEEEAIRPLKEARVLILDDIGIEKVTDWVRQALYVVIAYRERNLMPTVFTSNLDLDDLEERIGDERIVSRIAGMSRIIQIDGPDRRNLKEQKQ